MRFSPLSSYVHLRVRQAADKSPGGIWLPEIGRGLPSEAIVVAAGPGRRLPGSAERTPVWVRVGDSVLFARDTFEALTDDEGVIRAETLLALIRADGRVQPLNEWVAVEEEAAPVSPLIVLPDGVGERECSGRVEALGVGPLVTSGPFLGTHRSISAIVGLSAGESLLHARVWWSGTQEAYQVGGEKPCTLVRAGDLIAWED